MVDTELDYKIGRSEVRFEILQMIENQEKDVRKKDISEIQKAEIISAFQDLYLRIASM